MLSKTFKEFRTSFLLQFTKKLIENSANKDILNQNHYGKIINHPNQKKVKEILEGKRGRIEEDLFSDYDEVQKKIFKPLRKPKKLILRIPKTRLPKHLQYLKPTPSNVPEIELGKLNQLIKDPVVRTIQCDGPDRNIFVKGNMGTKNTNIVLTKQEIEDIIKKFSEATKIPTTEGLFKVVYGKLNFNAIISQVTDSRFIITKMIYNPSFG